MSTEIRRVVVIGASSVEGQVDPENGGFVRHLQRWLGAISSHHHIYNLGISGDTLTGIMQRLQDEVPRRRPQLIIIMLGLNDSKRTPEKTSPQEIDQVQYRELARQAIQLALQQAPVVVIGGQMVDETRTAPVSWAPTFYLAEDAISYAKVTAEVARELNVPYLAVGEEWTKLPDFQQFLAEDGLHPNAEGHRWIFERLQALLRQEFTFGEQPVTVANEKEMSV